MVEASTPTFDELTRCDDETLGKSLFELFAPSQVEALVDAGDHLMGIAPRIEGADAVLAGRGTDGDKTPDVPLHLTPIVDRQTTVAVLVLGPMVAPQP